jgi:nucleotidyltransferase/DNA polymerase involved in DNA repair
MPIACLLIPHFALRMALLEQPELDGRPLVLISSSQSRPDVLDCTPEAAKQGIRPGMLLREVTVLCPEAIFIEPNPVREHAVFEQMLRALETFSPAVEPIVPGQCYIDLQGLQRHDASLEAAMERLLRLVSPLFRPRIGVAPGKFTAWIAARKTSPGGTTIVDSNAVVDFLAPIPTTWLPLPHDTTRRLERLGLRTIGDLASLPSSAMQARFGAMGKKLWELGNGIDDPTVAPRQRLEAVVEALTLPAPSTSRDMLLLGIKQLVHRAFGRPELRYRYVRQARLQVLIEGNRSLDKELTFREPLDCQRVIEVLAHRLQQLELPGAAEGLILGLIDLVAGTARQERLPGLTSRKTRPLVEAARQLKRRYGASPLYHIVEVEPWSRIPERRHALISFDP